MGTLYYQGFSLQESKTLKQYCLCAHWLVHFWLELQNINLVHVPICDKFAQ
jgi:hypothetical protein